MSPKFKVGDKIEVIECYRGCGRTAIGKIVTIVEIGTYIDEIGYRVFPKIGNSETGHYNGFIGKSSFKLYKAKSWKERFKCSK